VNGCGIASRATPTTASERREPTQDTQYALRVTAGCGAIRDTETPGSCKAWKNDPFEQSFKQFFRQEPQQTPHTVRSLGSGFIINHVGYIVTNDHVVGKAAVIQVKLSNGRDPTATLVGRDPKADIALPKIDATDLPVATRGTSSRRQRRTGARPSTAAVSKTLSHLGAAR
jgi:S1-C subfamily serine protease